MEGCYKRTRGSGVCTWEKVSTGILQSHRPQEFVNSSFSVFLNSPEQKKLTGILGLHVTLGDN